MKVNSVECPKCGLSDRTFKVSEIYIEALEGFKKGEKGRVLPQIVSDQSQFEAPGILKVQAFRSVVNDFSPPSGGSQLTRPVHPNLVILAFSLIAVFFLLQIYTTQPDLFLPMLILVFVFYLGYGFFRKTIYGKYNKQIQDNNSIKNTYEAAIGKWMHLYYCARDNGVFDPQEDQMIPLESMKIYLLDQQRS
jgi:hypothetical protein